MLFSSFFRKPDIQVPYLYIDLGAAVLCASFMSFGVKRRWFALAAAVHLVLSTYVSYVGGQVHYGDWLKVNRELIFVQLFLFLVRPKIIVCSSDDDAFL